MSLSPDASPSAETEKKFTRVTADNPADGMGPESVEITNNYVVITDGTCYVAHTAVHPNRTHVVTIKGVQR